MTDFPTLKNLVARLGRMGLTLLVLALAVWGGKRLWAHYQLEPWTRDGRVRADVVQIAPDVSGLVTRVTFEHDAVVHRGDTLFEVDRERYVLALREAEAIVATRRSVLAQAQREATRNRGLGALVSTEVAEQGEARVEEAKAVLAQALAQRDLAQLNLDRTVVRAPVDGVLSDLTLRVGDYVSTGKPVFALIDAGSLRVEGYFEETKLARVRIGQAARVRLMGEAAVLEGHVQSVALAIEDRERALSSSLLPNVNPTFNWVRLAQRVPVRIALDKVPAGVRLVAGRTATVTLLESPEPRDKQP